MFSLFFHLISAQTFFYFFFFFNDTATTEIYTLSLHDALPISRWSSPTPTCWWRSTPRPRSEEHTSELQSQFHLVCRLLLEKKKKKKKTRLNTKKKKKRNRKEEVEEHT